MENTTFSNAKWNHLFIQLTTAAVEQYTGEGELPCCEMTLEAADYQTSHNANLNVSLIGAKPPNNIIRITRTIELSSIDSVEPYDGDVGTLLQTLLNHCYSYYEL